MGFNFPGSPSAGQVFTPAGGPSYKYQNGVWQLTAGTGIPEAPSDGHEYARQNGNWVDLNQMRSGVGAPAAALGDIGDYYINAGATTDITAGTIYGPKASGALTAAVRTLATKNPAAGEASSASIWWYGNRFTAVVDGLITKLWVYKSATSTTNGTQIQLWLVTGYVRLLWSGTITTIGAAGWYSTDIPGGIWLPATSKFSILVQVQAGAKYGSTGVQTSDNPAALTIDGATDADGASYPATLYNNANFWTDASFSTGPNIWPVAEAPLLDAPYAGVAYGRRNNFWTPVPTRTELGVFKISEGTLAVAGPSIDIDLPTTGYNTLELLLVDVAVPGSAVSISFDFSYDGGATFPNAAAQYVYSQSSTTSAVNGGFTASGGNATNAWVFWSIASTVMKGFGSIRMPVGVGGVAQQISRVSCYTGTAYISQDTWTAQNVITGPPNKGRLRTSSGNMNAGLRWQLNGFA